MTAKRSVLFKSNELFVRVKFTKRWNVSASLNDFPQSPFFLECWNCLMVHVMYLENMLKRIKICKGTAVFDFYHNPGQLFTSLNDADEVC